MARANTLTSYGSVTKSFHWLTALLIFSVFPLGIVANNLAHQIKDPSIATTDADIALTATLFSMHKTIGVAIFFVALTRIAWAISQPKPGLLNGEKTLEAMAATTVHWLLYSSLVIVPLSGWIHHAATTGFAPIWWPFGQSLPFVPKDLWLADQTAKIHHLSIYVMGGAVALHIAGAMKHHIVDRDATLRRMLPGQAVSAAPSPRQPGELLPLGAALGLWAAILTLGGALQLTQPEAETQTTELETVTSEWTVTEGSLGISVRQFGSDVSGSFEDWTAAIDYTETPDETGKHGHVTVTVNIASLTLGSVTDQAKSADYLDVTNHPLAVFNADIMATDTGHAAIGTLTIKDQSIPVTMPFDLALEGDTANASGALTVDRRDFLIGMGTSDEGTLSFGVDITFDLTAVRGDMTVADAAAVPSAETTAGWAVNDGALNLSVAQLGSVVEGSFSDWTAVIDYVKTPDESGKHGTVAVTINIASLTIGSVTDQAKSADFFDLSTYPTAVFEADIMSTDTGHVAIGTLTIKDQSVPVEMPFDLALDGNTATASGELIVDRRDFLIGMGTKDEATLGFSVTIAFDLSATRPGG